MLGLRPPPDPNSPVTPLLSPHCVWADGVIWTCTLRRVWSQIINGVQVSLFLCSPAVDTSRLGGFQGETECAHGRRYEKQTEMCCYRYRCCCIAAQCCETLQLACNSVVSNEQKQRLLEVSDRLSSQTIEVPTEYTCQTSLWGRSVYVGVV